MGNRPNSHAPGIDYDIDRSGGAHKERSNVPAGRPKTGAGHRDDAMLDMLEFRQTLNALNEMKQAHYRAERDLVSQLARRVDDATVSWRYGEIADQICIAGMAA